MEKDIHDDRLEDYVRKSFEDYEEAPASDMWGRIEADILPPPTPLEDRRTRRPLFWQLSTAAAILLLLSGLVCGRLYYENRIREITTQRVEKNEPEQQPAALPSPALPRPEIVVPAPEKPASRENRIKTDSGHLNKTTGQKTNALLRKTDAPTLSAIPSQNKRNVPPQTNPGAAESQAPVSVSNLETGTTSPSASITDVPLAGSVFQHTPDAESPVVPENRQSSNKVDIIALRINDIAPLSLRAIPSVSGNFALNFPVIRSVDTPKSPSGWYLGLHTTPVLLVEKPGPERTGALRPRLVSTQEKTSFSADYWLKLGKKGTGIWGFESGLGYRTIERNATHTARFRLVNGRPNAGGTQERSYDFDYDLDTYGGSAEVTLRMDQVDPGAVIPESEPLRIQVKTSERVALLRVPVLATARLGSHRLQTVFKAGLVGNIVLINKLDITTRVSENIRFRPAQGSNAYTLHPDKTGKFFLGYQFSAGLEYRSGRHLSWVLEPALAGDFARKNSAGKQLPSILTLGMNMGVNYWF